MYNNNTLQKRTKISAILPTVLLIFLFNTKLHAETLYLASLEWPPYSGLHLNNQGATVSVVREAIKIMGHNVLIGFHSWSETVRLAKNSGSKYHGYFPEYYSSEIEEEFIYSDTIGYGSLGFAQKTENPFSWSLLEDLQELRIGTVAGYINTKKFDRLVNKNYLSVIPTISDSDNLIKLINKDIDLAIIDPNVFYYLMLQKPALKPHINALKMNSKIIANKDFYVCFKDNKESEKWLNILNKGLKKINIKKIIEESIQ